MSSFITTAFLAHHKKSAISEYSIYFSWYLSFINNKYIVVYCMNYKKKSAVVNVSQNNISSFNSPNCQYMLHKASLILKVDSSTYI